MYLAFNYLPIVLLLASLSALELSCADKVEPKISVTRGQDGHMSASIFIKNSTCRAINDLSLKIDIHAVMDEKEKDEEIYRLWSIFCPEEGEELLKIVSRTDWGGKENVASEMRTQTADLFIVDGHGYTTNLDNFYDKMRNLDIYQTKTYGDLLCNFWISDDGKVFEGLGWKSFNYIYNGGLGLNSLIIGFFKKDRDAEPSALAIKAFKELVNSAICERALSLHYSLIPYYLIGDHDALGNDSFERKEMKTWNSYMGDLDFLVPCEIIDPQIIPKEKWRNTKPRGELMTLSTPIEYIAISQWSARCFFNCTNYLNLTERYFDVIHQTVPFNFLLTEEGKVYEVMGWEETWNEGFQKKKVIQVGFLGSFNSYGPSKRMYLALNTLIQDGLSSGKLSEHYNIVTIKTADQAQSHFMGNFLENEIRKLDRYTEKF